MPTRRTCSPGSTKKLAVSATSSRAASVPSIQNPYRQPLPRIPESLVTTAMELLALVFSWKATTRSFGAGLACAAGIGVVAQPASVNAPMSEIRVVRIFSADRRGEYSPQPAVMRIFWVIRMRHHRNWQYVVCLCIARDT